MIPRRLQLSSRQYKVSSHWKREDMATKGSTGKSGSKLQAETPAPAAEGHVCTRYHHAVELIGRRWSGAILSVLLRGPQGYNEMLAAVPGLSDRLLTERLREFESEGLVVRTVR